MICFLNDTSRNQGHACRSTNHGSQVYLNVVAVSRGILRQPGGASLHRVSSSDEYWSWWLLYTSLQALYSDYTTRWEISSSVNRVQLGHGEIKSIIDCNFGQNQSILPDRQRRRPRRRHRNYPTFSTPFTDSD